MSDRTIAEAIADLDPELKAQVVASAIDIAGRTLYANRERMAMLLRATRPSLTEDQARKGVRLALEILATLSIDAEEEVGE